MGSRRAARELALQYLFGHEFQNQAQHRFTPKEWFRQYAEDFEVETETSQFSSLLCEGVLEHQSQIDPIIQSHSSHWKISRMSLVDLNILRIAVYEMHFSHNPLATKIIINEAIDIAKLYGTIESGPFVNGLLDQVAKSLVV